MPITKLLIANRGEIASRIIRSARAMGIATVAVFSDPDEGMPFAAQADQAVRLPGRTSTDTYLSIDAVLGAAIRAGADAVHPGYGFLSERADFARACTQAGLVFVGPTAEAIALMGSKVEAKRLMTEAGVPVLPGVTLDERAGPEALSAAAEAIGSPMIVKAAFGGGGRGMRVVRTSTELAEAVASAQREAAAAFGDGLVFLERYVEAPRHIEVQIFGDTHGTVASLFERECSIQRRHQKIIEEAPSTAVDESLRQELCAAAVTAAKAIGYVNAGTVEFVLEDDGRFWFLEVNTRLQVEHPVTELITGLDLVQLQLAVAAGEPLPDSVLAAQIDGHAIEARLYAEDVRAGFMPTSGPVHRIRVPQSQGVRVDAGYADGTEVPTYYDGMLAKVIAWAPTRAAAASALADSLFRAELHGIATNRDLLVGTLRHPDFLSGQTDTAFFDRNDPNVLGEPAAGEDSHGVHAVAAAATALAQQRSSSPVPRGIPTGWRNVGPSHQPLIYSVADQTIEVDDAQVEAALVLIDDEHVVLEISGSRVGCTVHTVGTTTYVDSILGHSVLHHVGRFPARELAAAAGSLLAPLPGTVVRVLVNVGDQVTGGQAVMALEAMKMEHTLHAPTAGTVAEVKVAVGEQVDAGAALLVIDEAED